MSFLSAAVLLATLHMASTPSQEFDRGRTAFLRGEYERAVTIIYPLLYPDLRLESESDVVQAHRILGVSYLFENKQNDARDEFRKLLELSPDYRFDPLLDPPKVVEFFNGIVREQQAQLGDIDIRL
jgi:Flp pilus assembly protein TadD